ncbi:MAG: 16S rRNA (guanine(966)-N(2))-methyltransferase RsmD [Tissierellia bacterium]|jgi:16S rRNA (guanine(966)-N(2))-methyltransferase RsmD|nr:16S rRNA (guanine(966)-N(2))-methyltransferase RsmD [Tissierellia bacterium]
MRVIAGSARGIPLETIEEQTTRPTVDRVKENLFNILMPHIVDSVVCDFFSGSGSLCIEALSRGAEKAYFVERNPKAMDCIKRNLKKTKLEERAELFQGSYIEAIEDFKEKGISFDLLFLDPPHASDYAKDAMIRIKDLDILAKDGIIIIEHHAKQNFEEVIGSFSLWRRKKYGNTALSFYIKERE